MNIIQNICTYFFYDVPLKRAVKKADKLHAASKGQQQYYVLKMCGKIEVYSAKQLRRFKKRRILNKNFNWLKLQEICLYKTA